MKFPKALMLATLSSKAAVSYAASSDVPANYYAYVTEDTTPVCGKHHGNKRLCNLFVSCFPATFDTGITGEKWCPKTCENLVKYYPRQLCNEHNWNQVQAKKFTVEETNNQVCYTRPKQGKQCVTVDSFVDISVNDQGTTVEAAYVPLPPVQQSVPKTKEQVMSEKRSETVEQAGGSSCPGDGTNPNCLQFKLYWDNMDGTRNDFDMAIIPPSGGFLFYYASRTLAGGVCEIDGDQNTDYPVSNIYFADAPSGQYRVAVRNRIGDYGPIDAWIEVTRGNGYKKLYPFSFTRGRINMNCFTMYV